MTGEITSDQCQTCQKDEISSLAITNLQRKFDKLLFFYLFIRVGNFSKVIYKLIKVIYSFSSIKVRLIAVLWAYSAAKLVEIKLLYTIFALNLQNSKRKRLHKQI